MSNITIRQMQADEISEVTRLLTSYAFRSTPSLPERAAWEKDLAYRDEATYFAVFDDNQPRASAVSSTITQNIRGKFYQGGAIGAVTTHPAGRRQGYARAMLTALLARMREDGYAISVLYPFRESFYQRLGYTSFPQSKQARFSPVALQPLLKKDLDGDVELMELAQGFELYQDYLSLQHQRIHGFGRFSPKIESSLRDQNAYWLAVARSHGEVKGMMLYKIKGYGDDFQVAHFWYHDIQGRYLLLEWFARHIDHVKSIEVHLPPSEQPETWWADLNMNVASVGAPMGRVVDITRLNGMSIGPGSFTAHVHDEYCPWNSGTYRFEQSDGQLQINPATSADCNLSIQAVSALIYGTHEPATFAIRDWGDPSEQIQATMLSMFTPQQPYLYETF
ncbi:GNAT family N-acetyltransferase [Dictyobacter aurantiacus]|uniref:N-acetyltransferase domain-containing protein n=1 Tax=Dictyobacter aurantiacus TaxID=1936993 RepID=A0A401ZGE7_9CHLR|nr:GNAT family N-acetyltransferase [Dictyobacter aurantiacus]GCE05937.1 hypothetical protein KDAU_32660 [Dictyobacter aurantiacus]